ncbi:MAG: FCD domain-containing protein [Desulfobacterales bacterium]|nr:FCD domain-containing protein [Desulfobacterales bacterium]
MEKAERSGTQRAPRSWDEFMQADRDIHLALARLAGNPLHHFFLETVHTNFHRYHISAYLPRDEETIQTTLAELKDIVEAVSRGRGRARRSAWPASTCGAPRTSMQQASAAGGQARLRAPAPVNARRHHPACETPRTGGHP